MSDLTALWDALEARGAVVDRFDVERHPDLIPVALAAETHRLQVILEADIPGPRLWAGVVPVVKLSLLEDLIALVAAAVSEHKHAKEVA